MPGSQLQTIAQGGSELISYSPALILGTSDVFLALIASSLTFYKRDVAN
jgi:hypothetical protein